MSLFASFSLYLLNKILVVSCLGWIWPVKCFERFAARRENLENSEMVEKYKIIMTCCMSMIMYLVLLISQKDYELW